MKRFTGALLLTLMLAGCDSGNSGKTMNLGVPAGSGSNAPTCQSLIGKTLTRAMENTSCTSNGALQATADVACKDGVMVAFGNVAGGYLGKPVEPGNFADWPGC